jgi:uncharacterized protein (DUF1778 family)
METPIMSMRVAPEMRQLFDRAADILGKNRTDYMLGVCVQDAKNVILDQCHFTLRDEEFDRFTAALEASEDHPNEALLALLSRPSRWS